MKRPLYETLFAVVCFAALLSVHAEDKEGRKQIAAITKHAFFPFDRLFDGRPSSVGEKSTTKLNATSEIAREQTIDRDDGDVKANSSSAVTALDPIDAGESSGAETNRTRKSHAPSGATLCFEVRQIDNTPYRHCSGPAAIAYPSADHVKPAYGQYPAATYQSAQYPPPPPPSRPLYVTSPPNKSPAPPSYSAQPDAGYPTAAKPQHHDAMHHPPSAYEHAAPAAGGHNYPSHEPVILYMKPDYRTPEEQRDSENGEVAVVWSDSVADDHPDAAKIRSAEYGGYASPLTPLLDFHVHKNLLHYGEIPSISKTLLITKPLGSLHDTLKLLKKKHKKLGGEYEYENSDEHYGNEQYYGHAQYAHPSGQGILVSCQPTVVHAGSLMSDYAHPSPYESAGGYQAIGKSAAAYGAPYQSLLVYGPIAPYDQPPSKPSAHYSEYSPPAQSHSQDYRPPQPPVAEYKPPQQPPAQYPPKTKLQYPPYEQRPAVYEYNTMRPPAYGQQSMYDAAPQKMYPMPSPHQGVHAQAPPYGQPAPPIPQQEYSKPSVYPSYEKPPPPPPQQPYAKPYERPIVNYGQIVSKPEYSHLSYNVAQPMTMYKRPPPQGALNYGETYGPVVKAAANDAINPPHPMAKQADTGMSMKMSEEMARMVATNATVTETSTSFGMQHEDKSATNRTDNASEASKKKNDAVPTTNETHVINDTPRTGN